MSEETFYNSICNLVDEAFKPRFGVGNITYMQRILSIGIIDENILPEFKKLFKDVTDLFGGNNISNINLLESTTCTLPKQRLKVYGMIKALLSEVALNPSLAEITKQDEHYELKLDSKILSVKKGNPPEIEYTTDIPLEDVLT